MSSTNPPSPPSDTQAIIDITIAYCWALDTGQWHELDDVFLADATAKLRGSQSNRTEIVERVSSALEPFEATQHIVTNHNITVNDDEALCSSYVQAQHVWASGALFTIGGRYDDVFRRIDDGWRISHRTLSTLWTYPPTKQDQGA